MEIETKPKPIGQRPTVNHDRITAHLAMVYESHGEEPVSAVAAFDSLLQSRYGQCYKRTVIAERKWSGLDCGWVNSASLVLIVNRSRIDHGLNPTDEEKEELVKRVLQVRTEARAKRSFLVRPGRFLLVEPEQVSELQIRALADDTRVSIMVIPA